MIKVLNTVNIFVRIKIDSHRLRFPCNVLQFVLNTTHFYTRNDNEFKDSTIEISFTMNLLY